MTAPKPNTIDSEFFRIGPYPGLRPFDAHEAHLFFGRERALQKALERLAARHFLAIVGPSGSGKSSFIRAGLIGALSQSHGPNTGSQWSIVQFRPGTRPVHNLARALIDTARNLDDEADVSRLEARLKSNALSIAQWHHKSRLLPYANLLLVVDQFEEVFRLPELESGEELDSFLDLLVSVGREQTEGIHIVITMRSDFIGDCARHPGLFDSINEGQYLLPRLTRDECRQAIAGPAAVYGGLVEEQLVARLADEIGMREDRLPMMQHALVRL